MKNEILNKILAIIGGEMNSKSSVFAGVVAL